MISPWGEYNDHPRPASSDERGRGGRKGGRKNRMRSNQLKWNTWIKRLQHGKDSIPKIGHDGVATKVGGEGNERTGRIAGPISDKSTN